MAAAAKQKQERLTTYEVEASQRAAREFRKREEHALAQLHPAERQRILLQRRQFEQPDQIVFDVAKQFSAINRREKPKRTTDPPFCAIHKPDGPLESATQRALKDGVDVRDSFRHYYKKHMTIYGLQDQLDSSDSDSETSTNFQKKIFCRRHHQPRVGPTPLLEAMKKEQEEKLAQLRGSWQYHPPTIDYVGVIPGQTAPLKGKRIHPVEMVSQGPRPRNLTALGKYKQHLEEPRCLSSLANPWDERILAAEEEKRNRRHQFVANCPESPSRREMREKREQLETEGDSSKRKGKKHKRSVSSLTMRRLDDNIARIRAEHQESMHRHRLIMSAIES